MKVFLLTVTFAICQAVINQDYDKIIRELSARLTESQVKEDIAFIPGVQWAKRKGEYPSYMMFNYFGGPEEVLLRENFKIYDSNAFVTSWVTIIQLEAALFPGGPALGEEQLLLALDSLQSYQDRNRQEGSSLLVFWPQTFNETTGVWVSEAINLGNMLGDENMLNDVLISLLKDLNLKNQSENLRELATRVKENWYRFHITIDADDTFVNIGLGSLLHKYKDHDAAYSKWVQANPHISNVVTELLRYSYQPFGDSFDNCMIDPRSYYFLRNFLYKNENLGNTDLKLPFAWLITFYELMMLSDKKVRIAYNTNKIDLTVSTNVLYGITAAVLSDIDNPELWFNADVQRLYQNTVDMITYELQSNFSDRPNLALAYYPSKFVFYWFTSRTLQLLKSSDGQIMYTVMEKASRDLEATLRGNFTDTLIKSAIRDKSGLAYYDEFLGDDDKDLFGKPVNHAEDRIFCTSMAANTLLYTWREGINLSPTTPPTVVTTVQQLCNWLAINTLSGKFKLHNAFFSGSIKSNYNEMPFYYPSNYQHWINGTSLPKDINVTLYLLDYGVAGMLGMMDEDEYNLELKKKHFGKPTPPDFPGYNIPDAHFLFWSSDEFTYASVILALTQCQYLFD